MGSAGLKQTLPGDGKKFRTRSSESADIINARLPVRRQNLQAVAFQPAAKVRLNRDDAFPARL